MADLSEKLSAFLRAIADEQVVWGRSDCSAVPQRWLIENSIAAELPVYHSRDEAHAIIARHGSLVATWDWCLRGDPLPERHAAPRLGDIAVVDTRLYGQIGGVIAEGGILVIRRDDGGFHWFGPVRRFEKVWAVS